MTAESTIADRLLPLEMQVHGAVASVDDPEYPGISIVDLGLLESIDIDASTGDSARVNVGLIPTFSGCPALDLIASDVANAVAKVDAVDIVDVTWLKSPAWSIDRVSADARAAMAREFTVAVELGRRESAGAHAQCPRCGAETIERSMFGPSRCRSVHACTGCGETVEVMRG